MTTKQYQIFLVSCCLLLSAMPVSASEIYFGTHTKEAGVNQYVEVGVFLNAEEESINAVEGSVSFPSPLLAPKEIRNGNSIISFWVEQPFLEQDGKLRFSGVIPGGYTGNNGYLFSVIFQTQKEGEATLDAINGRALLNDGGGSAASFRSSPTELKIRSELKGPDVLPVYDPDAPESFTPQIAKDPNLFEGKWVLIFATQDKGSGVDHYEVREQRRWSFFGLELGIWPANWMEAESPVILKDQALKSTVYVKAQDRSRNERVAVLPPSYPLRWYEVSFLWVIMGAVVLFAASLFLWRKKQQKE